MYRAGWEISCVDLFRMKESGVGRRVVDFGEHSYALGGFSHSPLNALPQPFNDIPFYEHLFLNLCFQSLPTKSSSMIHLLAFASHYLLLHWLDPPTFVPNSFTSPDGQPLSQHRLANTQLLPSKVNIDLALSTIKLNPLGASGCP